MPIECGNNKNGIKTRKTKSLFKPYQDKSYGMKGLCSLCPVLNAGNQRVRKQIVKGVKSSYKTRQNGMQKMPFYLSIYGLLEFSEKQN